MTQLSPLERARQRGEKMKPVLLNMEGGSIPLSEAASEMGISAEELLAMISRREIIGVEWNGEIQDPASGPSEPPIMIPTWQITEGKPLPGLKEVLAAMPEEVGHWMALGILLKNTSDGRKRLFELLKAGITEEVISSLRYLEGR